MLCNYEGMSVSSMRTCLVRHASRWGTQARPRGMHTPVEELEEAGLPPVLRDMELRADAEPESPSSSSASPRAVMSCAASELAAAAVTSAKLRSTPAAAPLATDLVTFFATRLPCNESSSLASTWVCSDEADAPAMRQAMQGVPGQPDTQLCAVSRTMADEPAMRDSESRRSLGPFGCSEEARPIAGALRFPSITGGITGGTLLRSPPLRVCTRFNIGVPTFAQAVVLPTCSTTT
ncbi:MAG: hypothetical protein EOO65_02845 [Methanosarcinales archaeon]|nr:MAG: hypothetical protein EOO65_02845 [Methanosarcinales archaeon]